MQKTQKSEKTINKVLRKKPAEVIHDVDVIIFMVSGTKFDEIDKESLKLVKESHAKKILVINKIDLVKNKQDLFSFVENTFIKDDFHSIFRRFSVEPVATKPQNRRLEKSRVILAARLSVCCVQSLRAACASFEMAFEQYMFSFFSLRTHKPT